MRLKQQANLRERGFAFGPRAARMLLVLAVAGLCGCGAVPQSKYYELTAPAEVSANAASNPLPVTLLVGPVKGSHLYREDRLVYATNNEQMGTYQIHRWTEPPTEMVQELVWRSLRASHDFSEVNLLTSSARGDYVVQGNLYDFKEISGKNVTARVDLELELREVKTGAVVWTHEYSHDEPVKGKDVPAVVEALDQNAQRGVSEASASLSEFLAVRLKR
jgi:ABC-type uncharacterized transport system auxiliary subunit